MVGDKFELIGRIEDEGGQELCWIERCLKGARRWDRCINLMRILLNALLVTEQGP